MFLARTSACQEQASLHLLLSHATLQLGAQVLDMTAELFLSDQEPTAILERYLCLFSFSFKAPFYFFFLSRLSIL